MTSSASGDKLWLIWSGWSKLWSDFIRGIYSTSSGYKQLNFISGKSFCCLFLIIMLVLAMAKSVSAFIVCSGVQEDLAVLLSLMTLEAVQRTSWAIFWKKKNKNAVISWMLLTKFNSSVHPPSPMFLAKLANEKAERRKPLAEIIIVSWSWKIGWNPNRFAEDNPP